MTLKTALVIKPSSPLVCMAAAAVFLVASCSGCSDMIAEFSERKIPVHDLLIEASPDLIVGEEVYFNADSIPDVPNRYTCSYEWDFGDDSMPVRIGRSVTHAFMRPGTFTVNVNVKYHNKTYCRGRGTVTVSGEYPKLAPRPGCDPVLYYAFDDNLNDLSPGGRDGQWTGIPGLEEQGFCPGAMEGAALVGGSGIMCPLFGSDLAGLPGLTVSFWAKQSEAGGEGYLINCPGLFSVRLGVGGQEIAAAVTTVSGSASAEPWYTGADDTNWHHYVLVYDGSNVRVVFDGIDQVIETHCPAPLTGVLPAVEGPLYIGAESESANQFSGAIDEVKIFDRALTVDEIATGFELRHADFHARYAQYIYVRVPGEITRDAANTLSVTLGGDNGHDEVLFTGAGLAAEERILLNNSGLPSGNYALRAEIRSGTGSLLDVLVERFAKPYDGAPPVGIDENNAMRINGELIFPVTPFGLRNYEIDDWAVAQYINILHSQGFWGMYSAPVYTADGWEEYLDTGLDSGLRAFGPGGGWAFYGTHYSNYLDRNADVSIIDEYVTRLRDHQGMFAWNWRDEPELGGDNQYLPAEVVRAWTRRCHDLDPNHPTSVNLVGAWIGDDYPSWSWNRSGNYLYMNNANRFGRRTHMADIYSMDYYPIEWAAPHSRGATMDQLIKILDTFRERTGNLVPCISAIETCDINEADGDVRQPTLWHPTPAQLKMLAWITVVHGMKGILWFPWHSGTPDENYPVMATFVDQIGRLAPVVLGPEINPEVAVSASGARIETMVRQHEGATWLFAVQVNETDTAGQPVGSSVTATITVDGVGNGTAYLFDEEGRTETVTAGALTDDFDPCEVHIYRIVE